VYGACLHELSAGSTAADDGAQDGRRHKTDRQPDGYPQVCLLYCLILSDILSDIVAAVAAGRKHGVVRAGRPVHGFHFDSSPADDKHSVTAPTAAGKSAYILCIYRLHIVLHIALYIYL
jgi:hypothetical protein